MLSRTSYLLLTCLLFGLIVSIKAEKIKKFKKSEASSRIFNGTSITIEQAPYLVQLRKINGTRPYCTGTLISLQHVLTAGHCIEGALRGGFLEESKIIAGATLTTEPGVEGIMTEIFIHPNYTLSANINDTLGYKDYDAAIIKLKEPFVESEKIKAITELCSTAPDAGKFIRVPGWGAMASVKSPTLLTSKDFPEDLREARLPIISTEECRFRIRSQRDKLTDRMLCTYKATSHVCSGDSGGPGIYAGKLCAIVSWSIGCKYSNYPNGYTNVASVLDFIESKLKL